MPEQYFYCEIRKPLSNSFNGNVFELNSQRMTEAEHWLDEHGITILCDNSSTYSDALDYYGDHLYDTAYYLKFTNELDLLAFTLQFSDLIV